MYAIELYVPAQDNDGHAIGQEHWAHLECELTKIDGGFTRYATAGRWGGHLEPITVYRVLTLDQDGLSLEHRATVNEIARYIKKHWAQKSVVWTLTETEVNFS